MCVPARRRRSTERHWKRERSPSSGSVDTMIRTCGGRFVTCNQTREAAASGAGGQVEGGGERKGGGGTRLFVVEAVVWGTVGEGGATCKSTLQLVKLDQMTLQLVKLDQMRTRQLKCTVGTWVGARVGRGGGQGGLEGGGGPGASRGGAPRSSRRAGHVTAREATAKKKKKTAWRAVGGMAGGCVPPATR